MEELVNTFKEEYEGGIEQFEKQRYKNATILLSKSLFALCDMIILNKLRKLPKNHGERFRILEDHFPKMSEFSIQSLTGGKLCMILPA
ncbi:MAG: hypothetical protein V1740_06780 [Candidatus Woesearchaeota archaeon]